jgi:CHAT domain-containing protein
LAIFEEIGDRSGQANALGNLGNVASSQGRYGEASDYYQRSLAIFEEIGDRSGQANALGNLGTVASSQGRYGEASDYYQRSMDLFEEIRAAAGDDAARTSYIAQYAFLYANAVEVAHRLEQDEQAFFISERGRARTFLDMMTTGVVQPSDDAAQALYRREVEAYAVLQNARNDLIQARAAADPDEELIATFEKQVAEAQQEHEAALAAVEEHGGQLELLVPGRTKEHVLDVEGVQGYLDEQTALISYYLDDEAGFAFVITDETFRVVELEVGFETLAGEEGDIAGMRAAPEHLLIPNSAKRLYGHLIEPLKPLGGIEKLIIVPHGALHNLPFAALTADGEEYLVDEYMLSFLPSASSLQYVGPRLSGATEELLIVGPPRREGQSRLEEVEEQVQVIAERFGVQPFMLEEATEAVVRERSPQANIVHLASHAEFSETLPLQSRILLADGDLLVEEIFGLDLRNTDLVVLNACETKLGEVSDGDDIIGLTRGFFFAGAPTVVSSLWKVDEKSTRLLMERLYDHMEAGLPKAEALRQAQMDVRDEYPHFKHWAGFTLSGRGDALMRRPVVPVWVWSPWWRS